MVQYLFPQKNRVTDQEQLPYSLTPLLEAHITCIKYLYTQGYTGHMVLLFSRIDINAHSVADGKDHQ